MPCPRRQLFMKTVLPNTFYMTSRHEIAFLNSVTTATVEKKARWCCRKDLAEFRGLTDRERTGFLLVLEWFENYRLCHREVLGHEDITTTEISLHVATGANGLGENFSVPGGNRSRFITLGLKFANVGKARLFAHQDSVGPIPRGVGDGRPGECSCFA